MLPLLVGVVAFLLGSIPSGVVLSRALMGRDVREIGSGNFGAANVARAGGFRLGIAVALIDILKGVIPVAIGLAAGLDHTGLAVVALLAVIGHDFSIFLRLKGGKGVATTLGVALVLMPAVALLAAGLWVAVFLSLRYSSLASLLALAWLPIGAVLFGQPAAYVWLAAGLAMLGVGKHWENLFRLARGIEPKFTRQRPADGG